MIGKSLAATVTKQVEIPSMITVNAGKDHPGSTSVSQPVASTYSGPSQKNDKKRARKEVGRAPSMKSNKGKDVPLTTESAPLPPNSVSRLGPSSRKATHGLEKDKSFVGPMKGFDLGTEIAISPNLLNGSASQALTGSSKGRKPLDLSGKKGPNASTLKSKAGEMRRMWIWSHKTDEVYKAASGYRWLCHRRGGFDMETYWSWLWKIQCSEKIKVLLWLMLHYAIPTNSLRFSRNLASSPQCSRCGTSLETVLHCVGDCPASLELWFHFGFLSPDFFVHEVHQWVKKMLEDVAPLKFLVVLWWSWRWRNALFLNSEDWSLDNICFRVNMLLADMSSAFNLEPLPTRSVRVVAWCKPPPSLVKLNVDGCFRSGENWVGFGGLLRDEGGTWIKGFVGKHHSTSILLAELLALKNGLLMAWEAGFRDVQCETDFKKVMEQLRDPPWRSLSMRLDIAPNENKEREKESALPRRKPPQAPSWKPQHPPLDIVSGVEEESEQEYPMVFDSSFYIVENIFKGRKINFRAGKAFEKEKNENLREDVKSFGSRGWKEEYGFSWKVGAPRQPLSFSSIEAELKAHSIK
ncbi:hypothetical protein RIF29_21569 [Crotalaria pallida]|uniref:RNase H type-1 domain-containing protein n=1 Tax=Crotalaria pallida TaxID=3830 RepID=A0AAN9F7P1_CROPI